MNGKKIMAMAIFALVFVVGAFAVPLTNSIHLTGQTTDGVGGFVTGTFNATFNVSAYPNCSSELDSNQDLIVTDDVGRWSSYFDTSVVSSEQLWVGYEINRTFPSYTEVGCIRYAPTAYTEAWNPSNDYYLDNTTIWFNTAQTTGIWWDATDTWLKISNTTQVTGEFYVDNDVGIGLTNPYEKLDVNGSALLSGGDRYISTDTEGSYGYDLTVAGGWGGCFVPGTSVTTPTGFKNIEDLVVGDSVVSYNEVTSTMTTATVTYLENHGVGSYLLLNNLVGVMPSHPFYTPSGWVEAGNLDVGNQVYDGGWVDITSIDRIGERTLVYNLAVSAPNTYFVEGLLVHNKDMSPRPGGQLYLIGGSGSYGAADGDTYLAYDFFGAAGKVNVSGAYILPTTDGTTGQVLETDGSGNVTWEDASGGSSYWNRTGVYLYPATSGDYIALNGSNGEGITFDGTTGDVGIEYNSNELYIGSLGTNDIINMEADDGISLDGGNNPVTIEGTALALNGYSLWGLTTSAQSLLYSSGNSRWEFNNKLYVTGNITSSSDITAVGNFYGVDADLTGNIKMDDDEIIYLDTANSKTLHYDTADTQFEFNDALRVGDATNYIQLDEATAGIEFGGTARTYRHVPMYAYNVAGIAGTFNSISCNDANGGTLNGHYFNSFDDGGGFEKAEAAHFGIDLQDNYVDGSDIEIEFHWTTAGTSTNDVRWQAGLASTADGETYSPDGGTTTWGTPQNVAGSGTAWVKQTTTFTISGTGFVGGDSVRVTVFRDADNGADDNTAIAYVNTYVVSYMVDAL